MPEEQTKTCPVCGLMVEPEIKKCSRCGTDLTLFDEDMSAELETVPITEDSSVEELLGLIEKGREESPEVLEKIKIIGRTAEQMAQRFECPICNTIVEARATSCSGCGAQFIEEGAEQFKCPICEHMVDASSTKCPRCGALFEEEVIEEAPPQLSKPEMVAPLPKPAAVPEVKAAPPPTVPPPKPPEKKKKPLLWFRRKEETLPKKVSGLPPKELEDLIAQAKSVLLEAEISGADTSSAKSIFRQALAARRLGEYEKAKRLLTECIETADSSMTE